MNNLDADVAEHPEELVVYGGIGRAARDWNSFDRIVAALRLLADDETSPRSVGQTGRDFHDPPRCAARPHRQFQSGPGLGELGSLQCPRPQGADDVRPDDRGVLDLYRYSRHCAGHI